MKKHSQLVVLLVSLSSAVAFAQDMDIDQADSLNFESFHKDKKEAVKAWEKTDSTPTKAYQDQPTGNAATTKSTAESTKSTAASTSKTAAAPVNPAEITGKRYEIRERYSLTRSSKTPYSAFYVIEPLYQQSAQLCAKGWKKLAERSEPIEQDFYLYYLIECL